ncbi:MAG: hypothetical protein ABIH21_03480 [Patescibacteria group bacterium]
MQLNKEIHNGLKCDTVGKPHSLVGKTFCIAAHPGKMFLFPFFQWFEKRYAGKYKFARLMFTFDLFLLCIALSLAITAALLIFHKPQSIENKIYFDAVVAPREIVTGAPSTLIIRYTNGSNEELHNVKLIIGFPNHFLFQDLSTNTMSFDSDTVELENLKPGEQGYVKVRGVMFGDVGGIQTFRSLMTFTYGDDNKVSQKLSYHTFSPVRSTLSLELKLPKPLIAQQLIQGSIIYKNTGNVDFPHILIEPIWPEGFELIDSNVEIKDGKFYAPAIKAGEDGVIIFTGNLGIYEKDSIEFTMHPAFMFGNTAYKQESLFHKTQIIQPPLALEHSVIEKSLELGGIVNVEIHYKNNGEITLFDASIGLDNSGPYFKDETIWVHADQKPELKEIAPRESGTVTLHARLLKNILQSQVNTYEDLHVPTLPISSYSIGVEDAQQFIVSHGTEIKTILTTPLKVDSFARYTMPSGDQIGRGPLPPTVGEETKYWIFWNIYGTTNPIGNLVIEGELGKNVHFTGRQSVSQDEGIFYDTTKGIVTWNAPELQSTFSPTANVVGIGFEVGITPTEDQIGQSPILMKDVRVRGVDKTTGVFVTASGSSISTNLPSDERAIGKGAVID